MRFTRFEQIVLLAGGAAILCSMAISIAAGGADYVEVVAQGLLFVVLYAAVRLGRRGGATAAMLASVAYSLVVIASAPDTTAGPTHIPVLVLRLVAFGLVGIVGGELVTRFRYGLTKLGPGSALDDWSRVFNQEYIHTTISMAVARHERYGDPIAVIIMALSPRVFGTMKPVRQRGLVRAIAGVIRSDVRMMDEVARLTDGRFVILMPHTDAEGGSVARDRIRDDVLAVLGSSHIEGVTARLLALPSDRDAITALLESISSATDEDQEPSGAYSSSSDITLNPALRSAVSAPSVSTLNTSTAASPEGSTKQ